LLADLGQPKAMPANGFICKREALFLQSRFLNPGSLSDFEVSMPSMTSFRIAVSILVLSLIASPVAAQQHVLDGSHLWQAIEAKHADDERERAVVASVFERSDVRAVAARLNLDVRGAQDAISRLSGDELKAAAVHARAIQADLAGGQNHTITISLTTLLIVILLIVLIAD
jgi:hypothetical protein